MSRVRSPVRALRRTVPRTLFVAGVAVLGMAWLAPAAWGHASLDHAVPTPQEELRAPPTLLLLFFDERVSLPFSQVTVTANAGGGGPNAPLRRGGRGRRARPAAARPQGFVHGAMAGPVAR
jgi:hypothetical protein